MGVAVGVTVGVDVCVGVSVDVGDVVADGTTVGVEEEAGAVPPHDPISKDSTKTINQ